MALSTCRYCNAPVDVFMTECGACRRPIAAGWDSADGAAPTWGATEQHESAVAVIAPPATRSGKPAPIVLAWVIAVSPVALMLLAIAVEWWPNIAVLAATCLIVLALAGWDSRRLDRELIDVEWFWALLTPVTYLFVRAARTRRGQAAAWVGAVAIAIWFAALIGGVIVAVIESPQVTNLRLTPQIQEVAAAGRNYEEAITTWTTAPGNSEAPALQAAATRLSTALDDLQGALDGYDFPADMSDEVAELSTTLDRLSDDLDDVATAERTFDISRESCEAAITSYDNDSAIFAYLTAAGDSQAGTLLAVLPISKAGADFCTLQLPFLDAVETFVTDVRQHNSRSALQRDYETFAREIDILTQNMEDHEWPANIESEINTLSTAYGQAAEASRQVANSLDERDYRGIRAETQAMVAALKAAGQAEIELALAWQDQAEALLN
jgi:hypothetical protein